MRTAIAVIIGYALFALSAVALFQVAHRDPHAATTIAFGIAAIVYGMAFAACAGAVADRIARRSDLWPPRIVAALIALGATISLLATWRQAAHWSQWTAIFLMAPAAVLGGRASRARRIPPA
jgi:hypothetical protein